MSNIVNPADALPSFQIALDRGELHLQQCEKDKDLFVCPDQTPNGIRLTYARIENGTATALAIYFNVDPLHGLPCFQVGWAVPEGYRQQGRATATVLASLAELEHGFSARGIIPSFYVEAVVGTDNIASQKVAAATLSDAPDKGDDKFSGEPVLHYVKKIG